MTRVVAIVQARMGSTRLPGKALIDIAGEPMLARVVERARHAKRLGDIVIATTSKRADDAIVSVARQRGWLVTRGSEEDVLDRYHQAAQEHAADVIVRITSDCPMLSPSVVDRTIAAFEGSPPVDYASNTLEPRTFPRGLDVEVFSAEALERAWREDDRPEWREHVTPYIYRSGRFRLRAVSQPVDRSSLRWTVDTPEDLELVRAVYAELGPRFESEDAIELMERKPGLVAINQQISQKSVP